MSARTFVSYFLLIVGLMFAVAPLMAVLAYWFEFLVAAFAPLGGMVR